MRRAGFAALLFVACVFAGLLAAIAFAETPPPDTTSTSATTTGTTDTTTTSTTTTPATLPPGVTIGGVQVGGLSQTDAQAAVAESFARPVVLRYRRTTILIAPDLLGATADIDRAVAQAQASAPDTAMPLRVAVRRSPVSQFVAKVVHRFTRDPIDAQLVLRQLHPVITPSEPGRRFVLPPITDAVVKALEANGRGPIVLRAKPIPAKVTASSFGSVIVIRRGSNRLYLYKGATLRRLFGVATGQSAYPTPLGRFHVIVKWKDPWWYPPAAPWAAGKKPVPPGPGNPLGTRWMGISSPGVGIHGTPDAASIGYSASHGCIRMRIADAEWLFEHIEVGAPVFIVSA